MAVAPERLGAIDTLRGVALLGIAQVNVQCFTWNSSDPLGVLAPEPLDRVLYFLQAALIEGKFYPIFAFLFGAGLALQARERTRAAGSARAAHAALRRRLVFLLVLGLLHGIFLFSGDVLLAYALCGLLFLIGAPHRAAALADRARFWWLAAALTLLLPLAYASWAAPGGFDATRVDADVQMAHIVYTEAGWRDEITQRLGDEAWQQIGSIPSFWPQVMALASLGALAARLGWLRYPQRHPRVWSRARRIGLAVGLPCSLLGAALSVHHAAHAPGAPSSWDQVALGAGSLLAAAYVAQILCWSTRHPQALLVRWLAAAGRLSLTNYLTQSLVLGALLCGWGWGWGASADRAQLAALAAALGAVQVAASHLWLRHFRQGPLEALWRRWAYS